MEMENTLFFEDHRHNRILGNANLFTSLFPQTRAKYKKEARQI